MPYAILVAVLVVLDQFVKYWVSHNIAPGEHLAFLPHILDLTYVENTGAAFSFLSSHTWLLTIISLTMSIVLAWAVATKFFSHPFGRTALSLLLAGAIGNLIDRALNGFVVDMFYVLFMQFAVFNVADICVVVGGIAAAIYYLAFYDKLQSPAAAKPAEGATDESTDTDR